MVCKVFASLARNLFIWTEVNMSEYTIKEDHDLYRVELTMNDDHKSPRVSAIKIHYGFSMIQFPTVESWQKIKYQVDDLITRAEEAAKQTELASNKL